CLSDRVRLLHRNATSTAHATASDRHSDFAHEAGFFRVFCGVPVSGLVSAKANRGRICRLIANPIPVGSKVGERKIGSAGPSLRAEQVSHKAMWGQTLGRMAHFVANRCHTPTSAGPTSAGPTSAGPTSAQQYAGTRDSTTSIFPR